jgi:site-specific DNA-cytosine methylase
MLSDTGYDAEWQVISAADVGAPHLRERVWIVAYPASQRQRSADELMAQDVHDLTGTLACISPVPSYSTTASFIQRSAGSPSRRHR